MKQHEIDHVIRQASQMRSQMVAEFFFAACSIDRRFR